MASWSTATAAAGSTRAAFVDEAVREGDEIR